MGFLQETLRLIPNSSYRSPETTPLVESSPLRRQVEIDLKRHAEAQQYGLPESHLSHKGYMDTTADARIYAEQFTEWEEGDGCELWIMYGPLWRNAETAGREYHELQSTVERRKLRKVFVRKPIRYGSIETARHIIEYIERTGIPTKVAVHQWFNDPSEEQNRKIAFNELDLRIKQLDRIAAGRGSNSKSLLPWRGLWITSEVSHLLLLDCLKGQNKYEYADEELPSIQHLETLRVHLGFTDGIHYMFRERNEHNPVIVERAA